MQDQGSALRAWREKAGLSLETVAAAAGVSRTTVDRWEHGKYSPRAEQIAKMTPLAPGLLRALGIETSRRT